MLQCLTSHQCCCNTFSRHIRLSTHFSLACLLLSSFILFCVAAGSHFASLPSVHVFHLSFNAFYYLLHHPLFSDLQNEFLYFFNHFSVLCLVFACVLVCPCFPFLTLFFPNGKHSCWLWSRPQMSFKEFDKVVICTTDR